MTRPCCFVLALLALGCQEREAPLPTLQAPAQEGLRWPSAPSDLPAEARRCHDDYRSLADGGLPALGEGEAFDAWYRGAFQTWTRRYNDVRARCDEVFSGLDADGPAAQVVLAAQSYLHERLGEEASPYEEHAQMFVMARYWTLGAACTYQSCANGPAGAWATLCRERARDLPECPPVNEE